MTEELLAAAMARSAAATRAAMLRAGMVDDARLSMRARAVPKPRTDAGAVAERMFRAGLPLAEVRARTGISRGHAYRLAAAMRTEA